MNTFTRLGVAADCDGLEGALQSVHYALFPELFGGNTDEDGLEKLQYDLYYVKNYSIFIDLLILLQTAEVVMLGKGAQ